MLLLAGAKAPLPVESNGLRVLVRLGFAPEEKNYDRTYKAVQKALAPEMPDASQDRLAAYQLLRRHGQDLCRKSEPLCGACPLRAMGPSATGPAKK